MSKSNVQAAPVDSYKERPLKGALRTPEDHVRAEGRAQRVDQIPDYHETHPTLDPQAAPSQEEIDKAVQASVVQPKVTAKDLKDAVEGSVL